MAASRSLPTLPRPKPLRPVPPAVTCCAIGNPERAVNGYLGDCWASKVADDQWISVDLENIHEIARILLLWGNYPTHFKIRVSTDGKVWRTVAENLRSTKVESGEINDQHDISFSPAIKARHVRLELTKRANAEFGYALHEFLILDSTKKRP